MNENLADIIQIIISSTVSIIGFAVTIYMSKLNIRSEINKIHVTDYMNNYRNIEYDIAEILQLSVKEYLGIK